LQLSKGKIKETAITEGTDQMDLYLVFASLY